MSLPSFSTQAQLFSTAGLSASLFTPTDRYRLFAKLVYPRLAAKRDDLAKCYCADNGRVAIEPVLLLGISILQELDGVPDRQALEMLRYHAGWNFALNRQLGDELFHPTSLVNFRNRLEEHDQSALGFMTILEVLQEAGLVSRQSRQRLDSTQMFGRVARMSRLDCVRESLRLALKELEGLVQLQERPAFWLVLWERYVESQTDYRASSEVLARKLGQAGTDSLQLLGWLGGRVPAQWAAGPQAQLLKRVFAEQFEVVSGQVATLTKEKTAVVAQNTSGGSGTEPTDNCAPQPDSSPAQTPCLELSPANLPPCDEAPLPGLSVEPKPKEQLSSARVQNPHEPEATYAAKGTGDQKKEHVGYKVQVAETVCEAALAPGEPTRNFIVGMVTHPAYQSDEAGAAQMEAEQAALGLDKPPVRYVDGAYVSAQQLARAAAEGRQLMGPAPAAPDNNGGRFTTEQFQVNVEQRTAICPAGKLNTQCSRLQESQTGKVSFRFEWSTHCADCPLRSQCVGPKQKHRTIVVGEHHSALQARRQEQQSEVFKRQMKHRSAIEGTQSELVRAHGLRHARYRGLAKAKLQSYFIGAACNVKRWIRLQAWKLRQAMSVSAAEVASAAAL